MCYISIFVLETRFSCCDMHVCENTKRSKQKQKAFWVYSFLSSVIASKVYRGYVRTLKYIESCWPWQWQCV